MTDQNLCALPATELACLIRGKELSPVDAVNASLERIAAVQPQLNPFAFTYPEEALDLARATEAAIMRGDDVGPLAGVPIAIKDFTPTEGKRTTRGSYAFETWVPDRDPVIVRRLKAAGAIMVGKTTTPEFAFSSFTRSPLWGDTTNPWDPTKSAGGSSGGSGAAVASGCVPLAEGTDMGGSVRIPAALCGIVGLKPSLGRIPMDIINTVFDNISHFGPLARTVDDAALFLRVTEGPDEADISSQRQPVPLPDEISDDVAGLSLAVSPDLNIYAVDDDVAANFAATCAALAEAGATIEHVDLAWSKEMIDAWTATWGVYIAAAVQDKLAEYRDRLDPNVVALIDAGLAMDAVTYRRLEEIRTRQWHAIVPVFEKHDALLCPTMALPAPDQSARDSDFEHIDEAGLLHGLDMTAIFNNISQCPALSVPTGMSKARLPTAIQIVGRRFDDPTVLRVGKVVEALRPWAHGLEELGQRYAS